MRCSPSTAILLASLLTQVSVAFPSRHGHGHRRLHEGPRTLHPRDEFDDMVGRLNSSGRLQPNAAITPAGTSGTPTPPVTSGTNDEYVILFDPDHPEPPEVAEVMKRVGLNADHPDVKYVFQNSAFKGFVGTMPQGSASTLNSMAAVKFVEQPVKVSSTSINSVGGSTWGLQRISSPGSVSGDPSSLSFQYKYDDTGNLGKGVDIYIIDTGINTDHRAFGGRAVNGWSYNKDTSAASDAMGHGTHVAGTAAGNGFGVARDANLIGVKVLDEQGSGSTSDIVAGLDWIQSQHELKRKNPGFVASIASMSWAVSSKSSAVEHAISAMIADGVHASLAAGNDGTDACGASPADLGGPQGPAIVVGSMNIHDTISDFSNSGSCVDVFAPGESVLSAWIGGTSATKVEEGTSMACPHVTGIMAYLIGIDHSLGQQPAKLKLKLGGSALVSALLNGPTTVGGGRSLLASNGLPPTGTDQSNEAPAGGSSTSLPPSSTTPPPGAASPPPDPNSHVVTVVETVIVPSPTGS